MECSPQPTAAGGYTGEEARFNPCFNGMLSATAQGLVEQLSNFKSFNPCFNGMLSATFLRYSSRMYNFMFQSLF